LIILDYGNPFYGDSQKPTATATVAAFVRYVKFVTRQLRGRVLGYEIWNEWEGTAGHTRPGTPANYMRIVKQVAPVIRKNDPKALILGGAVTSRGIRGDFLSRLMKLGLLHYVDGVSIHPYIHCRHDSTVKAWGDWLTSVEQRLSRIVGTRVPLYITEIGWPTSIGKCGVSESQQAARASGVIRVSRSLPFVRGVWWYDLVDDGSNPFNREDRFGLLRSDLKPKPAYTAFKAAVAGTASVSLTSNHR